MIPKIVQNTLDRSVRWYISPNYLKICGLLSQNEPPKISDLDSVMFIKHLNKPRNSSNQRSEWLTTKNTQSLCTYVRLSERSSTTKCCKYQKIEMLRALLSYNQGSSILYLALAKTWPTVILWLYYINRRFITLYGKITGSLSADFLWASYSTEYRTLPPPLNCLTT